MIRIKTRSAKIVGVRSSVVFLVEAGKQACIEGDHLECDYECVKPREPKIFKIGRLPARHLLPNQVNVEL
jgi:hypothetical protein